MLGEYMSDPCYRHSDTAKLASESRVMN